MAVEPKPLNAKLLRQQLIIASLFLLFLPACGVSQSPNTHKIALLAPFEGKYRGIGYNALFAMRLAITDSGMHDVQLLAVDDGGNSVSALQRIKALNRDPAVVAVFALGESSTHPAVQKANDKALILIGNWGNDQADDDSLYAADANQLRDKSEDDLLIVEYLSNLAGTGSEAVLLSSGSLASASFSERFLNGDLYVPEPNLLATLTYDLTRLLLLTLEDGTQIDGTSYKGINGDLQFVDGFLQDAPLHGYRLENNALVSVQD